MHRAILFFPAFLVLNASAQPVSPDRPDPEPAVRTHLAVFGLKAEKLRKKVTVEARFKNLNTFVVTATNPSASSAHINTVAFSLSYETGGTPVRLILKEYYKLLHPKGGDASILIQPTTIWGKSRLRKTYHLDDSVTSSGGKTVNIDLGNGKLWLKTMVNNKMTKTRIHTRRSLSSALPPVGDEGGDSPVR
ncbi:MAG: hypothetical protein EOP88_11125 [Verrucomicrobiaceae bacterium]|nr:MAG: hypothetical protein EOP88_11125 [Verrucomicrobiaceae bacterium]